MVNKLVFDDLINFGMILLSTTTKDHQMKLNDTTRKYPRTMQEAFPDTADLTVLDDDDLKAVDTAEFCVYLALAFASGFLACYLFV
jgi:adenylate kinase